MCLFSTKKKSNDCNKDFNDQNKGKGKEQD